MSRPEPIEDTYQRAMEILGELGDEITNVVVVAHPTLAGVTLCTGMAIYDRDGDVVTAARIRASAKPLEYAAMAAIRGCAMAHGDLQAELRQRLDDAEG